MGLFKKKEEPVSTKCKECGLELHDPVRLDRHMKKLTSMYRRKTLMNLEPTQAECGKISLVYNKKGNVKWLRWI